MWRFLKKLEIELLFPFPSLPSPTPVFLPGKFHGERSLVGYSTRGYKESDMTEHAHALTLARMKIRM